MTKEEVIKIFRKEIECLSHSRCEDCILEKACNQMKTPLGPECIEALGMAIKALEQEPRDCKTCIHSDKGKCAGTEECHECMWESKYEQEPCDDCISREEALQALCKCVAEIMNLPSVTPQTKTGRWEWVQYDYNPKLGNWHCSECRSIVMECVDKNEKSYIPLYKYCPQCGARIAEPQESEVPDDDRQNK